jgi:GTP-binding protein SAR1
VFFFQSVGIQICALTTNPQYKPKKQMNNPTFPSWEWIVLPCLFVVPIIILSRKHYKRLQNWFEPARIVFIGIDNSGKTTLCYLLESDRGIRAFAPTLHPTLHKVQLMGRRVRIYDIGGMISARRTWKDYVAFQTDAIVFMLDVADSWRFDEASEELRALLEDDASADRPVLILANKLDRVVGPHTDLIRLIGKHFGLQIHMSERSMQVRDVLHEVLLQWPSEVVDIVFGFIAEEGLRAPRVWGGVTRTAPCKLFFCSLVKRIGYAEGFQWLLEQGLK